MRGTVEVDETCFGGKERNKRVKSKLGRGPVGKTAVVGAKNRHTKRVSARVVHRNGIESRWPIIKRFLR